MGLIANLMLCVLGIMIFLAYILINQLVGGTLKAKTYENAMLRCLGWNQSHIVLIVTSRLLLFQALPAAAFGLLLTSLATSKAESHMQKTSQVGVSLEQPQSATVIGLCCALILPVVALLAPMSDSLQV